MEIMGAKNMEAYSDQSLIKTPQTSSRVINTTVFKIPRLLVSHEIYTLKAMTFYLFSILTTKEEHFVQSSVYAERKARKKIAQKGYG